MSDSVRFLHFNDKAVNLDCCCCCVCCGMNRYNTVAAVWCAETRVGDVYVRSEVEQDSQKSRVSQSLSGLTTISRLVSFH